MSAYDNKYWSHRIAQLAEKVPETDDLSFFASEAYRDFTEQGVKDLICGTCTYLRTLGYDITKEQEEERINDMVVMMSTDENMTACTNGDSMIIGVNNSLVKYFPNRELRHYAIQGLRVHETAHVLFTDFKTIDMWLGALRNGNWWPVVPDHAQDPDGAELTQVLSKKEFSKSFAAIAGRLENAIEDGFIEREIKEMYKGLATTELCTTNDAMLSMASTFGEFLKAGRSAYSAMFQQVLMYAKYDITMVDDIFNGVIITKDHRYVKVMEYRPINFAYMDAETQNRVISLFYQTFKAVPCNIQFKTFARKADVESTISNVTQYYEQETNPKRKKMLNAYIGLLRKTALSVGITRRFFVVIEFQKTISNDGSRFELVVADLNAMAANVRSHMEQCGNVFIPALGNPDRNEDAGIHQLFYQLLNRSKSETVSFHDHMQPIIDRYSEAEMQGVKTSLQAPELIAPEWIDFTHYNYIVIDGKFYTFAYIPSTGYNQRVYAGWIATFVNAGEGIDVDMFFEHMSREAVYNKISTQLRMSRANAMDSHDTDSDYHARMEKISSSEYMLRGLSTGEDFYYMSMVITVVADSVDELEYKYDNLEKRVKGQGMKIRRANFMMEECFESALLPLGKLNKDIKRKAQRNVLTSGVASCYPFISFEMQDPDGIMIGTNRANNSLVTIDMFDTDVHANANAVILGSTGYGKTFTAQLFALRLSEMDTQVFIISPLKGLEDYGGGCKAVGGQFISMDPSSVNSINIMDIRVPDDEDAKKMDDYETTGSLLTKKIHTVKSFLHLVVKDMTQEEEQLIDTSLYKVYGRFGITNDNDSIFDLENGGYKKMPLLEDLQKEMQNVPELHRICNILNPLIRGSMACYNRPTNVDLKAKYIVFDFNGMKGPTLTMSMFVVLDFVWTKIKEDRAKRKAVFIDECWKLIGTDSNEMAAEDVVEIFRTIRAYGGSAFAMTQDISQFYEYKGGKYGKAVIGNADTKIIMHLIPSEAKALQAAIQLTDSEMENVSNLGRGQGLVCSGAAKLFVDFIAAPYEKQEITTDAKSFYLQEKALKEKQHKEEQERLAAEKTNSNTDANDDDADLLNVTF